MWAFWRRSRQASRDHLIRGEVEARVQEATAELVVSNEELREVIRHHRQMKRELEERLQFEALLAKVSTDFIKLPAAEIDREIDQALGQIGEFMGVDRAAVSLFTSDGCRIVFASEWRAPGIDSELDPAYDLSQEKFPWLFGQILAFESIVIHSEDELPAAASDREKKFYRGMDLRSFIMVPLAVGGKVLGAVSFDAVRAERRWSPGLVQRLKLIGEIFANALVRKRTEEAASRQRSELARADRMIALGTLVAGMAHEVNNPNQYILLNLPILRDVWRDAAPVLERHARGDSDFRLANLPWEEMREEVPELIEETRRGGERIKHIVSVLRDYVRGQSPQSMGRFSLNDTVRSALVLLQSPIKKATDHFSVDYDADLPEARGNQHRIEQVVVNLILNACQALADRGQTIAIVTSHDSESQQIVLTVRDTGRGIAADDLSRIMDPFFTTKRESGGIGLGLAVSAQIVEEHEGSLEITSEVGRGTVARLSLPVVEVEQEG